MTEKLSLEARQQAWEKIHKQTQKKPSRFLEEKRVGIEFDKPAKQFLSKIIPQNSRVLDIGSGMTPETYLPEGIKATLVDLSLEALSINETPGRLVADAEHLPFTDGSFPTILCKDLLPYLPNPDTFLSEVLRVLQRGGKLIIIAAEGDISRHDPNKQWLEDFSASSLAKRLEPYFDTIETTALKEIKQRLSQGVVVDVYFKAVVGNGYSPIQN